MKLDQFFTTRKERLAALSAKTYGKPLRTSLCYLDLNMYRHNTSVVSRFDDWHHHFKLQMMAIGKRRFLFNNAGNIIEVTDPLRPTMFAKGAFARGPHQLAYNERLGKWILIVGARVPGTYPTTQWPLGKYGDAALVERSVNHKGLRGIRIYDATDPANIHLLSEWSCDLGDPAREHQTGGGAPDVFYDGGRYAYVEGVPDDSFIQFECCWRVHGSCVQILDVADPTKPRFVANWWVPGQRIGEEAEATKWPEYGDCESSNCLHTSFFMPVRAENGGRYAYSCWGSMGLFIHDMSDITAPRVVGRFNPPKAPGSWPFHTPDITKLTRGFVITNPEPLYPDAGEAYQPLYVIDVTNPAEPREISQLPVPVPPSDAPYKTFDDKRGRFGPHNPPFLKAPGKPDPNFTAYSFFNAGLQLYDLSDPAKPRISGYFIPPQAGQSEDSDSHNRDVDVIFVEWDRRLIWVGSLTGLYCISTPLLGDPVLEPLRVSEWALPHINRGHP